MPRPSSIQTDNHWHNETLLGEGSHGSVYTCYGNFACKVFSDTPVDFIKSAAEASINNQILTNLPKQDVDKYTLLVAESALVNNKPHYIKYQKCEGVTLDQYVTSHIDKIYTFYEQVDTEPARAESYIKTADNTILKVLKDLVKYYGDTTAFIKLLHVQGMHHADIKPNNFMVCEGNIKIIDFSDTNGTPGFFPISLFTIISPVRDYIINELSVKNNDGSYNKSEFIQLALVHCIGPHKAEMTDEQILIEYKKIPYVDFDTTETMYAYADNYALAVTFLFLINTVTDNFQSRIDANASEWKSTYSAITKIADECKEMLKLEHSGGGGVKYKDMTRAMLYEQVKARGITGMSQQPKGELLKALKAADRRRLRRQRCH